jgi:hypothetical protein
MAIIFRSLVEEYFNTEEKGKATVTDLDQKSRPEQRDLKNLNKDCEKSE